MTHKLNTGWYRPSLWAMTALAAFACVSCDKKDDAPKTYNVNVQVSYPEGFESQADVTVTMTNKITGSVAEALTDASGTASFLTVAGTYDITASETREDEYFKYNINGSASGIVVNDAWREGTPVAVSMSATSTPVTAEGVPTPHGRVIIKELYTGGCQKDDGSGAMTNDNYVILYNNSNGDALLDSVCLAFVNPYNSAVTNYDVIGGKLFYEAEGWIPAGASFWTFKAPVTLAPGEQIVIGLRDVIDHTASYSKSVNLANAAYYAAYQPGSPFTKQVAPADVIPTSHYLRLYNRIPGTAWLLSQNSPAFFLFKTPDSTTPAAFMADVTTDNYYRNSQTASNYRKKVPVEWIVDGIEVFQQGKTNNQKRLTPRVDVGSVIFKNNHGYTVYRNVDKDATEAIAANKGKLIYGYAQGTDDINDGTTDPSGIDAEASIRNGARIIYKDTNNSTNDFHQRKRATVRDN